MTHAVYKTFIMFILQQT